jgi:hypothetical protein
MHEKVWKHRSFVLSKSRYSQNSANILSSDTLTTDSNTKMSVSQPDRGMQATAIRLCDKGVEGGEGGEEEKSGMQIQSGFLHCTTH